jgi:hypothetical protein
MTTVAISRNVFEMLAINNNPIRVSMNAFVGTLYGFGGRFLYDVPLRKHEADTTKATQIGCTGRVVRCTPGVRHHSTWITDHESHYYHTDAQIDFVEILKLLQLQLFCSYTRVM